MRKKKITSTISNGPKKGRRAQPSSRARSPAAPKASPRSRATEDVSVSKGSRHPGSFRDSTVLRGHAALLQLIHDSVIAMDLNGVITYWNRGAEDQYGWAESAALGQVAHVLLKTQFPQPLEDIRARLLCDRRWEGELVQTRRDGRPIVVASRWALQCDAQGQPLAMLETSHDITERKQAEAKLHQWNAQLEQRIAERTANLETANAQLEELNVALEEEIAERQELQKELEWLASFPRLNTNPVVEVDLQGAVHYLNPAAQGALPDLERRRGEHPWLAGWDAVVSAFRDGGATAHKREVWVGESCYLQTLHYVPEVQRVRIYGVDVTERKEAEEQIARLNQALTQHARELETVNEALGTANEELEVTNEELRVSNEDLGNEILERRRAEQSLQEAMHSLRQSEQRYRSLFENMLNGFAYCQMLFDDHGRPIDFVYLDVNAAFEKLTGLKEVVGRKVTDIIPGIREDHPELLETYGRVAMTGQPEQFDLEFKPLSIWLSLSVYSPERGYFVAVFDNITERKRAEQSILKLNQELEQRAQALERHTHELEVTNKELEAFTYTVSHDLRAPLNLMKQFSEVLLDDYGAQLPDLAQHLLHLIHENALASDGLAENVLTLARLSQQSLTRQPINMNDLVRQVVEEVYPRKSSEGAPTGTERQVEIQVGPLPSAAADPLLLKQVWTHLLANALKFTRTRQEARIEIGSVQEGGQTAYWVKDNGAGFEMAHAERLFRAFQRLHHAEDFEGNGLGLAIVERIIRRHGGRVWAQAQVDQGATFYFTLG